MQAGLLTEVITIQQPIINQDGFGANSISWDNCIFTRASVNYNSGNRVNENNEIIFAYQVTFTVRVYHQINERMRIIWKGKKYRILSIELDKHKQRQIIRAELINE